MSKKKRYSLVALFMEVFLLLSAFSVFAEKAVPELNIPSSYKQVTAEENSSPTPIPQPSEEDNLGDSGNADDIDFQVLQEQTKSFDELSYEEKVQYFVANEIASETEARDLADESKRDTGQLAELGNSSTEYYQNALTELEKESQDDNSVLAQVKSLLRSSLLRSTSETVTITNTGTWVERPYPGYTHRTKALIINPGPGQRVGFCVDPYYDLPYGETYVGDNHMNATVAKIIYWGYGGPHTGEFLQRYEQMGVPDPVGYAYCDTVNAVRVAAGITDTPGVVEDGCVQWLIQHDPIPNPFAIASHDKNATYDAGTNEKISEWFETSGNSALDPSFTVQLHSNIGIQREGDSTIYRTNQSWPAGTKFRLYLPWRTMGQVSFTVSYSHNLFQDYLFLTDNPDLQRAMSYRLTPTSSTTEIRVNAIPMPPEPIEGEINIKKQDSVTGDTPQGDASLGGAVFQLFRDDTLLKETTIKNNAGSFGKVQVGTIQPETGELVDTYIFQVKEKDPGNGYRINANTFTITPGKTQTVTVTAKNDVKRGGVQIQKVDKETGKPVPQGDASLKDAEFTIINRSANPVSVDGKTFVKDAVCKVIKTDDKGYAATAADSLPYGKYEIYESKASPGYKVDSSWRKTFSISEDNQFEDIRSEVVKEQVIRGGVQVQKHDKELDKSEALGGADRGNNEYGTHLEGIVFTIRNKSTHYVLVDSKEYEPGQDVKSITTHWNEKMKAYTAETGSDTLPYGTYTIRETATTDSYLLSDGAERTFTIREDGVIVTADQGDKLLVFKNQVVRGDFRMVKIGDGTSERLSVPWILTNETTGERHVVITDINGEFASHSDNRLHSKQTNTNDVLIKKAEAGTIIKQSEMKINTGLWFGEGEAGSMAKVDDSLGALPYGKYNLAEMRCEANMGYSLQSFNFSIYRDKAIVNLGTITDDKIEIETEALDAKTKTHTSLAEAETVIGDTVSLFGLTKGKKYEVRGWLVNLDDGSDVIIDGKKVSASHKFTAKRTDVDVKLDYELNSTDLAGKSVVVFVDLHQGVKLAEHHELDNEDQTIHFPKIETMAVDESSGDHYGYADEQVTITDKVSYTNLTPGEQYVIKGSLMNQSTGKALLDKNGKEIRAEKKFKPEARDGFIELGFSLDASLLAGETTVIFEELYQNDILIAIHTDIEDKNQMVHFPKIGTSAVDGTTQMKEILAQGEVTIVDTIRYENMPVGKELTVKGLLMDKDAGEPLLLEDKQVAAEVTFAPDKSDGEIQLSFTFDATELAGKTLVVYEKVFVGDYLLANHEDLTDENQTVYFPEIKTTAMEQESGSHYAKADEETTIVDTVTYDNLIPGKTYRMEGTMYVKTGENQGEPLMIEGNPITAEKEFTPEESNGSIELVFTFDSRALIGQTVVVIEDCYFEEVKVATHADINDEEQSVHVIEIGTQAWDKATKTKVMTSSEDSSIIDTVTVEGFFLEDITYTLNAIVMDKASGEPLKIKGNEVCGERQFTLSDIVPLETDVNFPGNGSERYIKGTIDIEIPLNILEVETTYDQELVVYEYLHVEGHENPIASHEDLEDKDQTVMIKKVENPNPQTGLFGKNGGQTVLLISAAALLILGSAYYCYRRRLSHR